MGDERRAYDTQRDYHSADAALAALAGQQHGVVSRAQLLELGLTKDSLRRRVERKRLVRLREGVYAVGHAALTDDSRRLAAVLARGPSALLSHRAAAELHGLLPSSPQFDVTVPRNARSRAGIAVHRSRSITPADRALVRRIPVTGIARTLVDLADVLDEHRLARAVHETDVRRAFDLRAIEHVQERVPGRTGRHRLTRVLAAYRPEPRFTRSHAERRLLELCERHGLPKPQTNVVIGGLEVDAYWPDADLVVEVDGREAHHTRRAFHEDRALDDGAALASELEQIRQGRRRALSR